MSVRRQLPEVYLGRAKGKFGIHEYENKIERRGIWWVIYPDDLRQHLDDKARITTMCSPLETPINFPPLVHSQRCFAIELFPAVGRVESRMR